MFWTLLYMFPKIVKWFMYVLNTQWIVEVLNKNIIVYFNPRNCNWFESQILRMSGIKKIIIISNIFVKIMEIFWQLNKNVVT